MSADALPQPWEAEGMTRDLFLTWVDTQVAEGKVAVVETLWNAYPVDEEGGWQADCSTFNDAATGRRVAVMTDEDEDYPPNVVVVRRRLQEA